MRRPTAAPRATHCKSLSLGFGRDQAVTTITSRGVEHLIVLRVNHLEGRIEVERIERPVPETSGTTDTLTWPGPIDLAEVLALVREQAALNAHARLQLRDGTCVRWCANRRAGRWAKAPAPADLADRVARVLEGDPSASWDDALRRIAAEGAAL